MQASGVEASSEDKHPGLRLTDGQRFTAASPQTTCYGGEDKQEALFEPVVLWKVLEAFLGKNRAQPPRQLVAFEFGPRCAQNFHPPFSSVHGLF